MRAEALVPLGVVTGAHGLRGELRVKLWNPDSDLLDELETVLLRSDGVPTPRRVRIDGLRAHKQGVLMFLEGVDDREAAERLRGTELCVARGELPELPDDEFYLVDLLGLEVQTADGRTVGKVVDTIAYPASEVACVRVEGGIVELPLLSPYLLEVARERGILVADHLDELDVQPAPVQKGD